MTDLDRTTSERLLRECRELLETDLADLVDELAPVLGDEILSLVDSTHDEARKAEYQRLRTDIQKRWDVLAGAFRAELAKQLQEPAEAAKPERESTDFAELRLVSEQEQAEQIVMREFVGRVSEACSEETFALDRRIGQLLGRAEDDPGGNRFGPPGVCAAVMAGCAAMYPDLDQYSLLLRQLERHLRQELPEIYRAMNEVLVNADILPNLKRSYRPATSGGAQAAALDSAGIVKALERLAQARSGPGGPGQGGGPGGGGPGQGGGGFGPADGGGEGAFQGMPGGGAALFETLQSIQATPAAAPGVLTNVVSLARESPAARQIAPLEAITLDIVAMLFDLIFDDEKVPNAIKGLVSRLQIPILKVAMVDKQFFADRGHPARRFLDSISGIAVRWGKTVDEGDPFYAKLSELVERIQGTFDQDVDVFGASITELTSFVTEHEAMEGETSRVVAEIVQRKDDELRAQRERETAARQAAEEALAPLLAAELPPPVEQFLRLHWCGVLQKHALLAGRDAPSFHTAERVAREVVWCVAPKTEADDRRRQAALLPKLVAALNQGLDQVGVAAEERRGFMDALMELNLAAIRGDKRVAVAVAATAPPADANLAPPASLAAPSPAPVAELQVTHSVENGVRIEEVSLSAGGVPADGSGLDRASLRHVKHLVRGDWVEFIEDDGQVRRERLTWISPQRSLFLFSNHASHRALSITPEALAHRLQTDTARLVQRDAPIFERALDGAIKALDTAA